MFIKTSQVAFAGLPALLYCLPTSASLLRSPREKPNLRDLKSGLGGRQTRNKSQPRLVTAAEYGRSPLDKMESGMVFRVSALSGPSFEMSTQGVLAGGHMIRPGLCA